MTESADKRACSGMPGPDGADGSDTGYALVEARLRIKELEAEDSYLRANAEAARKAAVKYKKAYGKLLGSRAVEAYLVARKCFGKSYKRVSAKIPPAADPVFSQVDERNYPLLASYGKLIAGIPDGEVGGYYEKLPLTIGIITDDFMFDYYADAVELVYLDPDNGTEIIDSGELDLVMYVSCWRGLGYYGDEDLPSRYHYYGSKGLATAKGLLAHARACGVPTVFQSIEDPVSYERFLPVAKECDCVFTSAEELVERYRADVRTDNVAVLKYGVNPAIHNPLGCEAASRLGLPYLQRSFFFAGAWYGTYGERCNDMCALFDGVAGCEDTRLYIADRNLYKPDAKRGFYPERYQRFIIPPFGHRSLQKVHKLFDVSINVNTVKDSRTMCAMRVYELQALGVPVLSNPSLAVEEAFPNVAVAHSAEEARSFAEKLDERVKQTMRLEGLRNVMTDATAFERVAQIARAAGLSAEVVQRPVYVVCDEKTPEATAGFESQRYAAKRFVAAADAAPVLGAANDGYVVRWVPDLSRSPYYLQDLVNGFKYSRVHAVRPAQADEEAYVVGSKARDAIADGSMMDVPTWLAAGDNSCSCLAVRV